MFIKRLALVATLAALGTGAAHAEFFGLLNGRPATPPSEPLSVEGAFMTGDGYQNIAARVNYQVSPELVVFGDVGLVEFGFGFADVDGLGFGLGAFFFLADQQIVPQLDVAVKGSFHFATLEGDSSPTIFNPFTGQFVGGSSADIDGNNISLEVLISGKEPLADSGLGWYANGGLNILGGDFDETELLIGGGVHLPLGPGVIYGGADLIDEIQFGVGYRYAIQ